ncbi:MAG: hypothetical protein N2489_03875 [Clostridia bacterium]|nr:hypothetical protein [Clostridia bacterium]
MIYIILLYFASFAAWLARLKSKNKSEAFYLLVIIILIPAFGPLYMIVQYIQEALVKSHGRPDEAFEDLYFRDSQEAFIRANKQKESDIVSITDALILFDSTVKKNMLINLLKSDSIKHIEALKIALLDEDTEASHYAAVALMDVKSSFSKLLYEYSRLVEKNPEDYNLKRQYASVLESYVRCAIDSKKAVEKALNILSALYGELIEAEKSSKELYLRKIECDIKRKDYQRAEEYCNRLSEACGESEELYANMAKLYYLKQDGEKLAEVIQSMKDSKLKFTNKGLEIIRFWSGGAV